MYSQIGFLGRVKCHWIECFVNASLVYVVDGVAVHFGHFRWQVIGWYISLTRPVFCCFIYVHSKINRQTVSNSIAHAIQKQN